MKPGKRSPDPDFIRSDSYCTSHVESRLRRGGNRGANVHRATALISKDCTIVQALLYMPEHAHPHQLRRSTPSIAFGCHLTFPSTSVPPATTTTAHLAATTTTTTGATCEPQTHCRRARRCYCPAISLAESSSPPRHQPQPQQPQSSLRILYPWPMDLQVRVRVRVRVRGER